MLQLPMTASSRNLPPAIPLQHPKHVPHLHRPTVDGQPAVSLRPFLATLPHNAAVERPRAAACSALHAHNEMAHLRRAASAPFHYAHAARYMRQRAAAQPQRYAAESRETGVATPPAVRRQWVDEGEARASGVEGGWLEGGCATRQSSAAEASQ